MQEEKQTARQKTGGRKKQDLLGRSFGRWTVIGEAPSTKASPRWLCRCACGTERDVNASALFNGTSKGCGRGCPARSAEVSERSQLIDRIGHKFGSWTVIRAAPAKRWARGRQTTRWLCRCVCGTERVVLWTGLVSGASKSCGCRRNLNSPSLGMSDSLEYRSWWGMRQRCNNTKARNYHNYGGRGIKVCERWESFANFLADMGKAPSLDHSVDRVNNNGHYEPGNCRWATIREQNNNRRRARCIENYSTHELIEELKRRGFFDSGVDVVALVSQTTTVVDSTTVPTAANDPDR